MSVKKTQLVALAVLASVLTVTTTVHADGWFSGMNKVKQVDLSHVLKDPHAYIDVDIRFTVYFNAPGKSYNPYYTRFSDELYGNVSAWPIDARLYDKRDFQRTYDYFFMTRINEDWKKLQSLDRLTSIEAVGTVREIFKGKPWIEIKSFRTVSEGLRMKDVKNVVTGDALFHAGRYTEAAEHYADAVTSRTPETVRADVLRKLGDAEYHAGDYDDARDAYRTALRLEPRSEVLQRGVAASDQALRRNHAVRRNKTFTETPQTPAPHTEKLVKRQRNGVDEIIQLTENPDDVEAEVAQWQLELEKRAARLREEKAAATAVSGEDETALETVEATEETVETTEGCGVEAAVVEEGTTVEEGCGVVEGCGDAEKPVEGDLEEGCGAEVTETVEETTEVVETTETVEETTETVEETTETVEETTETVEETTEVVETTETVVETTETVEQPTEGCGEVVETTETVVVPAGNDTVVVEETVDVETTEVDPKVVQVGDVRVRLPRLPFFGCEDVSTDDLRAVVEEIIRNPEQQQ